jgi:hypothetical protein
MKSDWAEYLHITKVSRCRQTRAIDEAEGPVSGGTATLSHLRFGVKMRPGVVWESVASLGMVPKHSNLHWRSCCNDRVVQSTANIVELEILMVNSSSSIPTAPRGAGVLHSHVIAS